MKVKNRTMRKELTYICLFIVLVSSMGSVNSKTCNWTQSHGNEAHTAHCDTDIVPPLVLLWKNTLEQGGISGSVASGDRLVLLSPLGTPQLDYSLLCFKIDKTGLQTVWRRTLLAVGRGTIPAIAGNKVICPSSQMLHCFDLETGYTVWETGFDSTPRTPIVIQDTDMAAVTTIPAGPGKSGSLSLVDISTGKIVWTKKSLEDVQCHFFDIATAGDGKIFACYATSDERGIVAFNLQGELLWKRIGKLLNKCADECMYVMLYTRGILFAVGSPTTLFALDGETGDVLWAYEGKTLLDNLSSDGKNIYVYSKTDEGVLCLDVHTGDEIWKSPPLFQGDRELLITIDKSVVSTRTCVFVCRHTYENIGTTQIFALDGNTGAVIWTSEELENLRGPLILCNDMVIAKASSTLFAFGELHDIGAPTLESTPESPPETTTLTMPSSTPAASSASLISLYVALILIGALIGIFFVYSLRRGKL